ncbi:MAG: thioredoxin domain-containing protein [Anaerolineales bacterium]|nr:thioredoxin domain-containing protein [Anaerolineales bacterium]
MVNKLISENSPYLLQHAGNPVDWYPWGKEALNKALIEDKPIFLSIGYAACHWCHVMAHESFEDPQIAAIMNEFYVNIKVDREERPDLDNIYMNAVVALTGQGGWPMSVFLTPDGKPFYGGTYFPPVRRYQMPAFRDILVTIAQLWKQDRSRLLVSGEELTNRLVNQLPTDQGSDELDKGKFSQVITSLENSYDWKFGGWGNAPKFPQTMIIEYLLRLGTRGDKTALDLATHALRAKAKGGMYDVIGGGFARYSVDDKWLVPHFEKMLYDNALLALNYLHAYLITKDEVFYRVCKSTLDFILRELAHPLGGFFSSLDADSEGEEGQFYTWSPVEINAALSNSQDVDLIVAAYGVTKEGNFEGKNVLQRQLTDQQIAQKFGLPIEEVPRKLASLHQVLLSARSQRTRPNTDDKVIVFWNALVMSVFAESGRYLRNDQYINVAKKNASFLLNNLYQEDRLMRTWKGGKEGGKSRHNAYLEDYSSMVLGLLSLYQSDPDPNWYTAALKLADEMVFQFTDSAGGFFDTRADHETLLYRPKDIQDNATPSGNALAAMALLQLSAYGDRLEWRELAEDILASNQELMTRFPTAFGQWLCAADFAFGPVFEVAIIGNDGAARTRSLIDALWSTYRPRIVAAISPPMDIPNSPKLLNNRQLINGQPTAYVCQNFLCQYPVNTPEELLQQLNGSK